MAVAPTPWGPFPPDLLGQPCGASGSVTRATFTEGHMRRQKCCQLRSPAFRVTLTWAWELRDGLVGVIMRVGMISSLSLPSAAEGWGTSALLLPRSGDRGLPFLCHSTFHFAPHLFGNQQGIDDTQDCCREAQDLSRTARVGREGQMTSQAQLHLSSLVLSHKVRSCKRPPVPPGLCRPGFSFQEKGGSGLCRLYWPELD